MIDYNLTSIKILHLEPTDACNAACPQCGRETDEKFDKNNLHHLSVNDIKKILSEEQITRLDKMFMCGDYGDPAAGKHTLEIYKYFRFINPNITLGMNTNGGLKSDKWWTELGQMLNRTKDYVVFSIDGLEDTNHIYRKNVNWKTVMKNAKAFIAAGGNAHWEMLVFEHNQHQISAAEQLAQNLGFKWFRTKVSRRFDTHPVSFLRPPRGLQTPKTTMGSIDCQAIKEQSLYISSQGNIYPCCWLGFSEHTFENFDNIKKSWDSDNPNPICVYSCAKINISNNFKNQWKYEVEFFDRNQNS